MVYGLIFKGEDGTSIVWFCLLLIAFVVHIFIMIGYMIFRLIKAFINRYNHKKSSEQNKVPIPNSAVKIGMKEIAKALLKVP